eukprot:jgi/Tetstr1/420858/TSEL_011931.t1
MDEEQYGYQYEMYHCSTRLPAAPQAVLQARVLTWDGSTRSTGRVEQVPVAVFDEFEALVLEAPLVVWDLCGAWFSAVGLACSSDPYRSAACPRSDRRLTCRANCIAAHLYDEALLFVWGPVWSVVWARVQQ